MLLRPLTILTASTLAWPVAAASRDLKAHAHGHVTLQIAVEGDAVEMALEAPGADIVGFEHAAKTDAQKAAVAEAQSTLADPLSLFVLPMAAGCVVADAEVELHQDAQHSAFEARYRLTCQDPSALAQIGTRLFDLYPSVQEIEVEYVTPAGQGAAEMAPGTALTLPVS
ncbi:MAG: DUF2796 domain-containing protein [Pseudomonadota bacterium]